MKRIILLATVFVMLISMSGCLVGWEVDDRGGRGGRHGRDGGHYRGGDYERAGDHYERR